MLEETLVKILSRLKKVMSEAMLVRRVLHGTWWCGQNHPSETRWAIGVRESNASNDMF